VQPDQVRITLDQRIAYYRPCEDPTSIDGATTPGLLLRTEPDPVLEVKHAGALPPWCRELVSGLRRSSYSKFRSLVQSLEEARRTADRVDRL
jgi:VTC domain-containing protein